MKRSLTLAAALLVVLALLLPLAACGGKDGGETVTTAAEEITEQVDAVIEGTTAAPEEDDEETTTGIDAGEDAAEDEEKPVPSTPAEVLAAYTEVMNKAKKDAKSMRKLEYQVLDKNRMNFEFDAINTPGFLDWLNDNLMTTPENALTKEQYTRGVTDMTEHLPVMHTPMGCMVKDPGVFSRAAARELPGGNIELTLIMKPEDNPEPAQKGASTSPSITGQMFNPLSKAGVDDLIRKARIFITTKLDFSLRYFDCKSVLVYDPATMQAVSLRQDYFVRINVANGRVLFINAKGSGVLEAATVCDQFRY